LQDAPPVKISAQPDCALDYPVPVAAVFREFLRLIRALRPGYVLVENVAALRYLNKQSGITEPAAIATVLADLASAGYDAEWTSLYAYQFGYPHSRERCFLIAYPHGLGLPPCFDDLPSCPKPCRPGTREEPGLVSPFT
jgi:DNA (cytosine-5)-methyltransferase 1